MKYKKKSERGSPLFHGKVKEGKNRKWIKKCVKDFICSSSSLFSGNLRVALVGKIRYVDAHTQGLKKFFVKSSKKQIRPPKIPPN